MCVFGYCMRMKEKLLIFFSISNLFFKKSWNENGYVFKKSFFPLSFPVGVACVQIEKFVV